MILDKKNAEKLLVNWQKIKILINNLKTIFFILNDCVDFF